MRSIDMYMLNYFLVNTRDPFTLVELNFCYNIEFCVTKKEFTLDIKSKQISQVFKIYFTFFILSSFTSPPNKKDTSRIVKTAVLKF